MQTILSMARKLAGYTPTDRKLIQSFANELAQTRSASKPNGAGAKRGKRKKPGPKPGYRRAAKRALPDVVEEAHPPARTPAPAKRKPGTRPSVSTAPPQRASHGKIASQPEPEPEEPEDDEDEDQYPDEGADEDDEDT